MLLLHPLGQSGGLYAPRFKVAALFQTHPLFSDNFMIYLHFMIHELILIGNLRLAIYLISIVH